MKNEETVTDTTTTYAVPMNAEQCEYEVHALDCRDLSNPRKRAALNLYGKDKAETFQAATPEEAARLALASDFSGKGEHPARDGWPEGSYGAAGFAARILPCARKRSAR
jgi:hypothetical protein